MDRAAQGLAGAAAGDGGGGVARPRDVFRVRRRRRCRFPAHRRSQLDRAAAGQGLAAGGACGGVARRPGGDDLRRGSGAVAGGGGRSPFPGGGPRGRGLRRDCRGQSAEPPDPRHARPVGGRQRTDPCRRLRSRRRLGRRRPSARHASFSVADRPGRRAHRAGVHRQLVGADRPGRKTGALRKRRQGDAGRRRGGRLGGHRRAGNAPGRGTVGRCRRAPPRSPRPLAGSPDAERADRLGAAPRLSVVGGGQSAARPVGADRRGAAHRRGACPDRRRHRHDVRRGDVAGQPRPYRAGADRRSGDGDGVWIGDGWRR